ncbi:Lrp/AsnC family transcriptional regulator [Aestuariivirga sp.]|uniref:Lrp/AsnC family transcriptional regulator n=1 Tax=Aestuariivirga sp. TaxID=2650926 RepID=UPI0025B99438|nr:Lrp/AsnC family transcriptional regulator [Aestuariivirga sp.]MCA3555105.1 Lrp/AsnC family transcriptional regulator [Aestuariivirga sp.]
MLDAIDRKLLAELQKASEVTAQELAEVLGLSASQVARRRQRLAAEGYILGYSAKLAPKKLGLGVQAFIQVEMAAHNAEAARGFASLVATMREVTECWTLTGAADYLLRVWCTDLGALNGFIQHRLLPHPVVARVESKIVMEQLKPDSGLPIP